MSFIQCGNKQSFKQRFYKSLRSKMCDEKFIIIGQIVTSTANQRLNIFIGYLAIENGKIVEMGSEEDYLSKMHLHQFGDYKKNILSKDQFVMPGLVDCHTHGPQFPNLGVGLDRPLLDWLDKYTFPLEKRYSDVDFASRVYSQVVKRLLTNGTTTASYFASIHLSGSMELVKSAVKHGQRALVGKVSMNISNSAGYYNDIAKEVADTETFITKVLSLDNDLVAPVVTPRFAVSCNKELMTKLAELASGYNCRIQSHVSENIDEIAEVLKQNTDCTSYSEVYEKCNILTKKCILAHAVHLSPEEIDLLNSYGVSIAHCPASNTRLLSGLCPVRNYLDAGIPVGLGTDVSGGDSASILDAMRRAMDVSTHIHLQTSNYRPLDWTEVFHMATYGGAVALNLEDKIGSLEVGKDFDALIVTVNADKGAIDDYGYTKEDGTSLVQRFVYLGDDRNITSVYVKGRLVKCV